MDESCPSLGKFFSVLGDVTQASCLSRRTGILPGMWNRRLGSLRDVSGWKPKLRSAATCRAGKCLVILGLTGCAVTIFLSSSC